MTTRFVVAAGLVAALAGATAVALARPAQQQPRGDRGQGAGQRGGGLDLGLQGIELSEAQRDKVRSIQQSHRAELDKRLAAIRIAQRAFGIAVQSGLADENEIRARATAVGKVSSLSTRTTEARRCSVGSVGDLLGSQARLERTGITDQGVAQGIRSTHCSTRFG